MHLHRWSRWEDVKVQTEIVTKPLLPFPWAQEVIVQQRRCSVCNKVLTRRA